MRTYRVEGTQPVVIDGTTHRPGATLQTDSDVAFLEQIGAVVPVAVEAPPADDAEEGEADRCS